MTTRPTVWIALPLAAVSIFAFCAVSRSSAARQSVAAASTPASEAQSSAVHLPVLVLDKHNQLVTNLTASDFTLTDDGNPQTIKSLTVQSDMPFRVGLLVDTSRGVYSAIDSERKAADKFVDLILPAEPTATANGSTAPPNPSPAPQSGRNQAFLIHFDREVELLEDFTSSRDKLHREIDGMTATSHTSDAEGPETSGDDNSGGYGQHSAHQDNGPQLYDAIYLACDELMKSKHGRKALVVFSDGADHGSKETLNDAIDAADRANVQVFTIYLKGEEERPASNSPRGGHRGGMGGGWPGGGGGWPGGGGGNRGGGAPRSEAGIDGKKIMQEIASRTGGQFFEAKKKENLDEIYSQIAMLLNKQYLLTYIPNKTDNEGDFHKIVLKTNKSDLTVYTREGYYDPND